MKRGQYSEWNYRKSRLFKASSEKLLLLKPAQQSTRFSVATRTHQASNSRFLLQLYNMCFPPCAALSPMCFQPAGVARSVPYGELRNSWTNAQRVDGAEWGGHVQSPALLYTRALWLGRASSFELVLHVPKDDEHLPRARADRRT